MSRILLVCPEYPTSYWSLGHALKFTGRRASMPPLGLMTVAALLPETEELRLIDMNVSPLRDEDLAWADLVMTSTMLVQKESLHEVIQRCNAAGVPVACGGPHPTSFHEEIQEPFLESPGGPRRAGAGVDHFVLGEVEETLTLFLDEWKRGVAPEIVPAPEKPDVSTSPRPRFDLIDLHAYGAMTVQFSRGCPFNCEFCDITKLYGRVPRTKPPERLVAELEELLRLGWRGAVFVVDDNFVGNKRAAMELLAELARWQEANGYPFAFFTEASLNVATIPGMLPALAAAGFNMLFLGIESPNDEALQKTVKPQNTSRTQDARAHMLSAIRSIHEHGLEVSGGFIIGLDGDTDFDGHVDFIQEAGIPMAMTGLLGVIKGTDLHARLESEGRLRGFTTGNNTDMRLNFEPELPADHLLSEYRRIVSTLYEPTLRNYFERCWTLLSRMKPHDHWARRPTAREVAVFPLSLVRLLPTRVGPAYARFLWRVARRRRRLFPEAVRLGIMGHHFERVTRETMVVHSVCEELDREFERLSDAISARRSPGQERLAELVEDARVAVRAARARARRVPRDCRQAAMATVDALARSLEHTLASARDEQAPQRSAG